MIYLVLAFHFLADFVCQTDSMALKKSSQLKWLCYHIIVYTLVMSALMPVGLTAKYIGLQATLHLWTDFWTSRLTAYLWKKGKRHYFFVAIGFDQLLHTVALIWFL